MLALHHSFIMTKWGWTPWTLLYFTAQGALSLVTVHQPPLLATALGLDATMPCELRLTQDETMVSKPVLYWSYFQEDGSHRTILHSDTYKERVQVLDNNENSWNKSRVLNMTIVLQKVQWADSGRYQCKLSVTTKKERSFRSKGNLTSLAVYDSMLLYLTGHNTLLLRCEVNVTRDAGFVLTVLHGGCRLNSTNSAAGGDVSARPYVTLSETIAVQAGGKYECQLHLKEALIMKKVFHSDLPEGAETNVTTCLPGIPVVIVEFPEPWLLYVSLLLVPITVLLGLATTLLLRR